jgi:hypothetical protein
MAMTNTDKKWMSYMSWVPSITFAAWLIYILVVTGRLIERQQYEQHDKVVTLLAQNYRGSFTLFMIMFLIGLAVLVAFIVHLKKVRTMNGSSKLAWLVFLAVFMPISLPVYYYIEVRHEPDDVPMYASLEDGRG